MQDRIDFRSFLKEEKIDGAWIQKDENCRYLSGFTGSESFLLITGDENYLITDSRYVEQAEKEAAGFTVIDYKGKLAGTAASLIEKHHIRCLGVEEMLTWKQYQGLSAAVKDCRIIFCCPDRLRQIKKEEELRNIQEACRISDEGFRRTVPLIRGGRSEKELRCILECAMLEAGSEGKSFDTIVASGNRSAFPHGTATDKIVEEGDLITFDFGAIYNGYHSDITRTVAIGRASETQRAVYSAVLGCVSHIEGMLKEGVRACDADAEARNFLRQFGYDRWFIHALGHSVGLEIHETPVLAARDQTILRTGMIETVEPGVYIPGTGGVRIEDTVAIENNGNSVYTKFPKALMEL